MLLSFSEVSLNRASMEIMILMHVFEILLILLKDILNLLNRIHVHHNFTKDVEHIFNNNIVRQREQNFYFYKLYLLVHFYNNDKITKKGISEF